MSTTFPPTPKPETGQGPWLNEHTGTWWVVADHASDAVRAVDVTGDLFPTYFGWKATIELVCIRWVAVDDWSEENEIEECRYSDDPGAVEAWRITVENA